MRHNRDEVIERTIREFELLDRLVANLSEEEWLLPLLRPESKQAWNVKDALAHITHWKADAARSARGERRPIEERGLGITDGNHRIFIQWRDSSPREVLAWHRQVQQDVLATLRKAPDAWFNARERDEEWPFDMIGHSAAHRLKDIQQALEARKKAKPQSGRVFGRRIRRALRLAGADEPANWGQGGKGYCAHCIPVLGWIVLARLQERAPVHKAGNTPGIVVIISHDTESWTNRFFVMVCDYLRCLSISTRGYLKKTFNNS